MGSCCCTSYSDPSRHSTDSVVEKKAAVDALTEIERQLPRLNEPFPSDVSGSSTLTPEAYEALSRSIVCEKRVVFISLFSLEKCYELIPPPIWDKSIVVANASKLWVQNAVEQMTRTGAHEGIHLPTAGELSSTAQRTKRTKSVVFKFRRLFLEALLTKDREQHSVIWLEPGAENAERQWQDASQQLQQIKALFKEEVADESPTASKDLAVVAEDTDGIFSESASTSTPTPTPAHLELVVLDSESPPGAGQQTAEECTLPFLKGLHLDEHWWRCHYLFNSHKVHSVMVSASSKHAVSIEHAWTSPDYDDDDSDCVVDLLEATVEEVAAAESGKSEMTCANEECQWREAKDVGVSKNPTTPGAVCGLLRDTSELSFAPLREMFYQSNPRTLLPMQEFTLRQWLAAHNL